MHIREEWVSYLNDVPEFQTCQRVVPTGDGGLYVLILGQNTNQQWLAKYDAYGKRQWHKELQNYPLGLGVANNGDALLMGFNGSVEGFHGWVERHADATDQPETKRLVTIDGEFIPHTAIMDADENLYVAGSTAHTDAESAWLAKYDPNGKPLWQEQFGHIDRINYPTDVITDGGGNVFVSGYCEPHVYMVTDDDDTRDAWLAKFDGKSGVLEWNRMSQIDHPDQANGIAASGQGIFTAGEAGAAYVARYSLSGTQIWVDDIPVSLFSNVKDIAADGLGNIYVCGEELLGAHWAYVAKFQIKIETISDMLAVLSPLMREVKSLKQQVQQLRR